MPNISKPKCQKVSHKITITSNHTSVRLHQSHLLSIFSNSLQWPKRTHTNVHQQHPQGISTTTPKQTPNESLEATANVTAALRVNATSSSVAANGSDATSIAQSVKDFHSENGDIKLSHKLSDKEVAIGNSSSDNVEDLAVDQSHHKVKHKKAVKKTKYQDFDASLVKDEGLLSSIMKVLGLNQCPATPPDLQGPIEVDTQPEFLENVEKRLADKITPGGRFKPSDCRARDRVAVVIPFRDRKQHLPVLLKNLHPFLMRQQIDYGIFIVEQSADGSFNRAKLMNVGFTEALKLYEWDCFVFHDVDLLPMDDRNLYTCPDQPRHMSVAVDTFGFK